MNIYFVYILLHCVCKVAFFVFPTQPLGSDGQYCDDFTKA